MDSFLKDLNKDLDYLMYNDNIDHIYHNFSTTLSTTINKFSIEVSSKKNNKNSNPFYNNNCKISKKAIRDTPNETLSIEKINIYKSLIEMKKIYL